MEAFSQIIAQSRKTSGLSSELSKIRASGDVPGIIYSKNGDNINVTFALLAIEKMIEDRSCFTRIFSIKTDEKQLFVILKDIQFHPVSDAPTHCDFAEVLPHQVVIISVPVRVLNRDLCPGIKLGGDVYFLTYHAKIKGPIEHIPETINVDISGALVGQKFYLKDAFKSEKCSIIKDNLLVKITGKKTINDLVAKATEDENSEKVEG